MKLFFTFYSGESIERLHHFFKHYRGLGVTNFYAIYHTYGEKDREVLNYVMKNAMVVKIWDGEFDENLKVKYLNEARLTFSEYDEWSFMLDCDEFVDISVDDLGKIIKSDANYCKFTLVDRFSDPIFKKPTTNESLEETYPLYSHFTSKVLGGAVTKVFLSRREVIVGLGLHDVISQWEQVVYLKKYPLNGWINHFKWTDTIQDEFNSRIGDKFVKGISDDYLEECQTAVNFDYSEIEFIPKPLDMKLLFIVWSLQDFNTMKQFFKHYRGLGVTRFYCIFHTYGMEDTTIYDYVSQNATIVHHWDEPYTTEWEARLKNKYKREIVDHEDEWLWVVDADEFVDINQTYIREVLESDANYVNGWMIDRFSPNGLIQPEDDNMFKQFPLRAFYTRYKLSGSASKITLTKGYVILGTGHHVVLNGLYDYGLEDDRILIPYNKEEDTWIEVAHMKWTNQILEDIYNKFTKTMDICKYSAREQGIFVLEYCYKKTPITELIKDVLIK
jgi:hypothetical protein